jgi:hypothetical protein
MVRAIVACVACVACQGQGTSGAGPAGGGSASGAATREDAGAAVASGSLDAATAEPDAPGRPDEPDGTGPRDVADPGRVIAELGAIPVWQAVVDRAQLLARRGQHGVVFGRVGPALLVPGPPPAPMVDAGVAAAAGPTVDGGVAAARPAVDGGVAVAALIDAGLVKSPYVWLVDDTEGNGSLGIRIALGDKAKEGDRIAAGGAWQLDADRRWFWKPDAVQPLPPAPASDLKEAQPPVPSHAIASGELPGGARTIGVARDGDAVYFQIVGPAPGSDGDGWQIADQLGSPAVAVMNLPGERPSYGGQDMRASDERWQLRRGQTYWVRIGKLRKRGLDKPAQVNARTAPIRVL